MAQQLVWASKRIAARLSPTLDSLASELEIELKKLMDATDPAVRLYASHGFAVAALRDYLDEQKVRHDLKYCGSLEAAAALAEGACDVAGFHVPIGTLEQDTLHRFAAWLRPETHCSIHLAVRSQCLFVAARQPARGGNAGRPGPAGCAIREPAGGLGHAAAAGADAGAARHRPEPDRGLQQLGSSRTRRWRPISAAAWPMWASAWRRQARRFGLEFVPVLKERCCFAIEKTALHSPALSGAVSAMRSAAYRERVNALPGYDGALTGTVLTFEEAFPGIPL